MTFSEYFDIISLHAKGSVIIRHFSFLFYPYVFGSFGCYILILQRKINVFQSVECLVSDQI